MSKELAESGSVMQRIDGLINELKTIMADNGISQTRIVSALDGKCSRNTVLNVFKGDREDADPKLSTLLMILDACRVELRLETERSREAIMSGDIASYRADVENIRAELEKTEKERDFFKSRYEELADKNTSMTSTIEKQQAQIETYMARMQRAEEALYSTQDDIRRKDARIVELSKQLGKW